MSDPARRQASRDDLLAGGVFVALGVAFAVGATRYDLGSALNMGPGYVPLALGLVLAVLGLVIGAQGLAAARGSAGPHQPSPAGDAASGDARLDATPPADADRAPPDADRTPPDALPAEEPRGPVPWGRGALLVAAVLAFGLTVRGLGLVPALFLAAFLAALAGPRTGPVRAALVAAGLTAVCVLVFVAVLQLRLPLLGTWLPR